MPIAARRGLTCASQLSQTVMPIAARGVSPVLRVYHRRCCFPSSTGLSFALSPSRGHDIVTPWLWAAMPNAVGTFLLLHLASLCSLLFSFLLFLLD
ncbi:hypothetical protein AMTRI_Chr08g164350 [Amborella trichopoda]